MIASTDNRLPAHCLIPLIGMACLLFGSLPIGLSPVPAVAAGTDATEYYPLAVGNQWEYEIELAAEGTRQRLTRTVAGRFELEDGAVLFTYDSGKHYLVQSREGIIMIGGMYELRSPIVPGSMWSTEDGGETRPLHRVARAGVPLTIQGRTYEGCVEIIATTGYQPTSLVSPGKESGTFEDLSTKVHMYFAPGVGPILTEWYQKTREGTATLRYRSELVRFSPGPTVAAPQAGPSPQQIEEARRALRRAASVSVYPAHLGFPQGGAAPYTEEAAAKIDAAAKKLFAVQAGKPSASPEGSAAERLRRSVEVMRQMFREAGYDYDATIVRFVDDTLNRSQPIPPRSFMPLLVFQLGALVSQCRVDKVDCPQFFTGEAAAVIRKLADLESRGR